MDKFVIDAFAWIEYLEGSQRGEKVKEILDDEDHLLFTSAATLAEITSKFLRMQKNASSALRAISTISTIIAVDQ